MILPLNLPELREFTLTQYPTCIAFESDQQTLSFVEFWQEVDKQAAILPAIPLQTPVVPSSRNHLGLILQLFALWQRRVVPVPLNPRFPSTLFHQLLARIRPSLVFSQEHPAGDPLSENPIPIPDPIQVLIATSGSTGLPKLVGLSLANFLWNAWGSAQNLKLEVGDRWLLSLPLFHVGGMAILFRTMLAGATTVLAEQKWNAEFLLQRRISHLSLVPTQLKQLLEDGVEPGAIRALLLGGAAIPPSLLKLANEQGLPLHTSYGCSEMASQVATTPVQGSWDDWNTTGFVLPHREVRLCPNGQIQLRGRTRFHGYWEDGELQTPFDADGWFTSSDIGEWDTEGRLKILGRMDRMFISGGENVHPETIEQALRQIPGIEQVVVVDIPDERYGARPVAFLQGTSPIDEGSLRELLRSKLAGFQLPDRFYEWPEFALVGIKPELKAFRQHAQQLHVLEEKR